MVFSDIFFLFEFLPIFLICYFAARKVQIKNLVLVVFSVFFYAWGEPVWVGLLLFSSVLDYCNGRFIEKHRGEKKAVLGVITSCAINLSLLGVFKYSGIIVEGINALLQLELPVPEFHLPIGISFYTFQSITYVVDVYRGQAKPQKNYLGYLLYLSMFFQLVAGPIVRYNTVAKEIENRSVKLSEFSGGLTRLIFGLGKKVLIANSMGQLATEFLTFETAPTSVLAAWAGVIMYSLQIYYDFSGYSDIAIGLSQMLGLHIKENFNFPYLSTSITEFWRRWHISLGTWFREYVYIPLGGSRKGTVRTLVNIGIVFVLTGIWHGTGLTYLAWGIVNGICNMAEKLLDGNKLYERTPKGIKWLGTMGVTLFCWQLFRASSGRAALYALASMVGLTGSEGLVYTWSYYFDAQIVTFAIIGFLGATVFGLPKVQQAYEKLQQTKVGYGIRQAVAVVLFVLSVLFMVNSTYSPFLYFQY